MVFIWQNISLHIIFCVAKNDNIPIRSLLKLDHAYRMYAETSKMFKMFL